MFQLRDYQLEAADLTVRELEKVRSTCVIWATGLGKTTLAAELIRRWHPEQCMFVCERKELAEQAADRIFKHTGIQCGIERGDYHVNMDDMFSNNRPVVASIQSLNSKHGEFGKRMYKFKPKFVFVDEFHHSCAPQYERFFNYLGPETKLVGLSATPKRLDGKALGKHFETVAHKYELKQAIDDGWLCDIAQEYIQIRGLDFSKIRTVRGDLDASELKTILQPEEMVQRFCQPSLEIVFGVERGSLSTLTPDMWGEHLRTNGHAPFRTIMFCASVLQAQLAAEVFNRATKDVANWISGEVSMEDRHEIMQDFRAGRYAVLTNCAVLGEGVDVPQVEVILQARPTKSLSLWIQQLGRGTRTLPGVIDGLLTVAERKEAIAKSAKQWVRVVDFVGNSGRHKLISSIDILGGEMSEEVRNKALDIALAKGKPVAVAVTLSNAQKELERQKEDAKKRIEDERKRHLLAGVEYKAKKVNPFSKEGQSSSFWIKKQKAIGVPATDKQCKLIGKCGIYPIGWTKKQAGMIISLLVNNNWRLPADPQYDWIRNHGRNAA